jgi:hypothetical protein
VEISYECISTYRCFRLRRCLLHEVTVSV